MINNQIGIVGAGNMGKAIAWAMERLGYQLVILDQYEEFPKSYQKKYFYLKGKKIMFYIMNKFYFKKPPKSYVNTIKEGYKNCNIDLYYSKKL